MIQFHRFQIFGGRTIEAEEVADGEFQIKNPTPDISISVGEARLNVLKTLSVDGGIVKKIDVSWKE